MRILLILLLTLLCAGAAQAATPWEFLGGISLQGADVSPSYWQSFAGGEGQYSLVVGLKPFKQVGPDSPTSVAEILPWAKKSLSVDIPFIGDPTTVLKPRGLGISESAKVAQVFDAPISIGIGWQYEVGWCWYTKAKLATF